MSVQGGLFAGVAAIAAQATAFGIISDNIANANTIGFKETEARFTTLVTRAPTANAFAPGGVASRPLSDAQQQGLLKGTTSATDLAVDGNGFFVVNGAATPGSSDPYMLTRAGSFITDESGRMKNTGGHFLQGWRTDSTGTIINSSTKDLLSSLETVDLGQFSQIASPTSAITIAANLPANKTMGQTETTNLTIYDSEGFDYLLRVNWTKGTATATTLNVWTYTHTLIRDPGQSTAASVAVTTAPGRTMVFNPDGTVRSVNGTAIGTTGTAATETLAITSANFGKSTSASTLTFTWGKFGAATGMSQFNASYNASLLNQDGSGPSALTNVSISDIGLVEANFANGLSRAIYKVPLATVPSPTELGASTGNAYLVTSTSGDVVLNVAQSGGSGSIASGTLENSTVDIAEEFTDLIITQRAYNASTRIITTGDELLEEIIRVKR